ncbi:MAG: enoyl-CoA hydratase/isomerase family protein [Desulfobacteraceae bacterium]|nr:enoyl-CoA hydratase/isomerase family protein [Desulfobacteraceae bacterium]
MIKERIEDNILIAVLTDGKTNSIDFETLKQIDACVEKVNNDDNIKGLVLTGEGKFFSSGFNLPMFLGFKDVDEAVDFFNQEEEMLVNYFMCKKPVVCAMNGHSAAAGMIFAMASDYRIVSDHPKIKLGMSEIKIGLPLTLAQSQIMRFGLDTDKKFRDIMYFGEMYGPEKSKELGLVDEVVAADELLNRAKAIVSLWIDTPNRPFIRMKEVLKKEFAEKIQKRLKEENWQEGMTCFFEKDVRDILSFVQAGLDR